MIKELTPDQEARLPEYREKWRAIGLCTDPANRPVAEEGAKEAYECCGEGRPRMIIWCDSPLAMGISRAWCQAVEDLLVKKSELVKVEPCPSGVAWLPVKQTMEASYIPCDKYDKRQLSRFLAGVYIGLIDRIENKDVQAMMRREVGRHVVTVPQAAVSVVYERFRESMRNYVGDCVYGQHDAHWLGFYEFFREVLGLEEETKPLLGLTKFAKNASWMLPHKDVCWVCERHSVLHRDDDSRLHCDTGPAVAYPDGWQLHAIHGVVVNKQVVEAPGTLTVEDVDNEENAEVRRIMLDRYDWPRYLRECGAKVIDFRDNYVENTKEALMQTKHRRVLVCACPSTAKTFCMPVPDSIETCAKAQAWLWDDRRVNIIGRA